MKLKIRLDMGEGPFEVETNLWVVTQWERKFKRKVSDFANGVGIEDLAFMAHIACQSEGIMVPIALDDFIKKLVLLDVINEADDIDRPTEPAPSAGL